MSDYSELKSKAEAILPGEFRIYEAYEEDRRYSDSEVRQLDFMALATPEVVLSLLAENKSLKGSCKALGERNLRSLERANRRLERENAKHVENRKEWQSSIDRKSEEIDQLKARIEFYSRSAQLLDEALGSAEKVNFQNGQKVYRLEDRIERLREMLGSFSYLLDYPDEESAEVLDDLRKDAERYRRIRKRIYDGERQIAVQYRNEKTGMSVLVDGEQLDSLIDATRGTSP